MENCYYRFYRRLSFCPRGGGDLCPSMHHRSHDQGRGVSVRETPCTVTSGWYASYWNAFLFVCDVYSPLVMALRRMCSLFCRGIPHGSCWLEVFPYQIQFRHPASVLVETPVNSRSFPPPCELHQVQSLPAQHLRCSAPWPSCFQLHFVRKQSCLVWKLVQMVQIWRNP